MFVSADGLKSQRITVLLAGGLAEPMLMVKMGLGVGNMIPMWPAKSDPVQSRQLRQNPYSRGPNRWSRLVGRMPPIDFTSEIEVCFKI